MLDRADSPKPSAAAPTAFPAWARALEAAETEAEAAFLAGAALARLDAVVRQNLPWAGAFRRRLTLSAAATSVARAGRIEDEAALRDALHLTRSGADPGPAGRHLLVWRELAARSAGRWRSSFQAAADAMGVPHDEALQEAIDAAEAGAADKRPAPFAAAQVFGCARRALTANAGRRSLGGRGGQGELLAAWLADAVLGQRLNWPFALPLLAAQLCAPAARRAVGDLADGAETARILFAYAKGAARPATSPPTLAGGRKGCWRSSRNCAPRGLRPRCRRCSTRIPQRGDEICRAISKRGSRRLFDRLVALGAVRELTGRATFRLYGL